MTTAWQDLNYKVGMAVLLVAAGLVLVLHLDPANRMWGFSTSPAMKYAPALISLLAMLPILLSGRLVLKNVTGVLSILCLWLIMLVGSLQALGATGNVENTFLGRALYLLPAFPAYFLASHPAFASFVFRRVMVMLSWYGILASAIVILHSAGINLVPLSHIYHEEVVLFPASAAATYFLTKGSYRHALIVFIILGMLLTKKNTGFLMAAATLFMMGNIWLAFVARRNFGFRLLVKSAIMVVLVLAALLAWIFRDLLPHGSPGVRLVTYAARLDEFTASPWVGNLFTGDPLFSLTTLYGTLQVPSHSDFLDLLAAGGIVAMLLLFLPIFRSVKRFFMSQSKEASAIVSVVIILSFVVVMMANPVMNQPLSFFFCLGYGFLLCQHAARRALVLRI